MIRIHPANQIAVWLWVACILQVLQGAPLFVFSALCAALALTCCKERCLRTLRHTRWLLLAIVLVYGWSTPGQYLWAGPGSPTEEGALWGAMQVTRLLGVLAALQILLWRLNSEQVFSGLYTLFAPLSVLGLNRQRWALRLSLTLRFSAALLVQKEKLNQAALLQYLAEAEAPAGLQEVTILVESLSFFNLLLLWGLFGAASLTLLMTV